MFSKFSRFVSNVVVGLFPDHIKRMIFCTTVYAHLALKIGIELTDSELEKVNRTLKLAHNLDSLNVPAGFSEAIWAAIPCPPLDADKRTDFCDTVLSKAVGWLQYGTEEKMRDDLNRLLSLFYQEHSEELTKQMACPVS